MNIPTIAALVLSFVALLFFARANYVLFTGAFSINTTTKEYIELRTHSFVEAMAMFVASLAWLSAALAFRLVF